MVGLKVFQNGPTNFFKRIMFSMAFLKPFSFGLSLFEKEAYNCCMLIG